MLIRIAALLLASLLASPCLAQPTAYDDRLGDNRDLLNVWRDHLLKFQVWDHSPPTYDGVHSVEAVFRAAAEQEFAFADGVETEYEERYRQNYAELVRSLQDYYPRLSELLGRMEQEMARRRESSDELDQRDYADQVRAIKEAVEWGYLALPFAVFEGNTPYHDDIHPRLLALYRTHVGGSDYPDLLGYARPNISAADLGSSTGPSVVRPDHAAQRAAAERERAAAAAASRAETQAATAAEVARYQADADAAVAEELSRTQTLLERSESGAGGSLLGGLFKLLLLLALIAIPLWIYRERLPPPLRALLIEAEQGLRRGIAAGVNRVNAVKRHLEQSR